MINISHFYKSLLSKDIENNINAKIENIKNTHKWSDLNVKSACEKIDFSNLGINDLKYHAAMLENISKLSVDLILDYDYYKKFIFKGHFRSVDYDDKLKKLGYEIEDDYWQNVTKPSNDTVIINVFLSCLYNSLVEIMDNRCKNTELNDTLGNVLVEDYDFQAGNKLIIKTCDTDMNRIEEQTDLRNSETTLDITNNTLDEKDESKNENHSNIDRISWICEKCTFQNGNENDKCSYCGSLNVVETEWKCWNKNCERMNKIGNHFCQTCKLDKTPPDPETKLVKIYTRNEMREIWICGKCEKYNAKDQVKCEGVNCGSFKFHINNDCKDNKNKAANQNEIKTNSCQCGCHKCTFINNGNGKRCTVCNSRRNDNSNYDTNKTSSSWKCWFENCKQINDDQYKFCQHCKLDRFGNRDGSALVKCQDKNGEKDIWICQKCFKYNSSSDVVCGGKTCKKHRFKN